MNKAEQSLAVPSGWAETQDALAAATGLALISVHGNCTPPIVVSNDNSICRAFLQSKKHAHLCKPYCGQAYTRAAAAGRSVTYRCHAGLNCIATPVRIIRNRRMVVIGGRAFFSKSDYRELADRFIGGDLRELLADEPFSKVMFADRADVDDLVLRVASAAAVEFDVNTRPQTIALLHAVAGQPNAEQPQVVDLPFSKTMAEVCVAALAQLSERFKLESLAFLQRQDANTFEVLTAIGEFATRPFSLQLDAGDKRVAHAALRGTSIVLQAQSNLPADRDAGALDAEVQHDRAELFPLLAGNEVKSAVLIGNAVSSEAVRATIGAFCRELALPLEILRLREELEMRERLADSLQQFTEQIQAVKPTDTYLSVLRHSAELLGAERSSLLLYDQDSDELEVKAALGPRVEMFSDARVRLGESVAGRVLQQGTPLVVRDVSVSNEMQGHPERRYKTGSFISYPIIVGGRKLGVLNVTDKSGGGSYDEVDLSLIDSIAPQMALALDRADWHAKAAQFELMSITDPLTGLLNRRYLEERLAEELMRSQRYGYSMSFMMIDIDDFKHYNDRNGHQSGDRALEITAQCLKSSLRSADIAARYGGEEFCILLPQTTVIEALAIAERIRRRIERQEFPNGEVQPTGRVTVSIGVSSDSELLSSPATIIGAADRALYLAKHQGKNRVHTIGAGPASHATLNHSDVTA